MVNPHESNKVNHRMLNLQNFSVSHALSRSLDFFKTSRVSLGGSSQLDPVVSATTIYKPCSWPLEGVEANPRSWGQTQSPWLLTIETSHGSPSSKCFFLLKSPIAFIEVHEILWVAGLQSLDGGGCWWLLECNR